MHDSNSYVRLTINGKKSYRCLITPDNIIIESSPYHENLIYKNLDDLYLKFGDRMRIREMSVEKPPMLIDEDIYESFVKKNPELKKLAEKFNCEIL